MKEMNQSVADPSPPPRVHDADDNRERDAELFRTKLADTTVNGLKSLPSWWREYIVPSHDPKASSTVKELLSLETVMKTGKTNRAEMARVLENVKIFFTQRVAQYKANLCQNPSALNEICALTKLLDKTYRQGYDGIFRARVLEADSQGLEAWTAFARKSEIFQRGRIKQSTTDLAQCYEDAIRIFDDYVEVGRRVGKETGTTFQVAPLKHCFRAFEKIALRHDAKDRYQCDNVYDVVRGALVYSNMDGVLRGVKALLDCKDLCIVRVKDRFSPGRETSGGWRDVVVSAYLQSDRDRKHVVEIQIHHKDLLLIRKNLGGHHVYSMFRSLIEALEVVFGEDIMLTLLKAPPLRSDATSVTCCKDAGYSAEQWVSIGYRADELKAAGYSAEELYPLCDEIKSVAYGDELLCHNGDAFKSGAYMKGVFFTKIHTVEGRNTYRVDAVKLLWPNRMNSRGPRSAKKNPWMGPDKRLKLKVKPGTSLLSRMCRATGENPRTFFGFNAKRCRDSGLTAIEMRDAGFTARECRDAGFDAEDLFDLCTTPVAFRIRNMDVLCLNRKDNVYFYAKTYSYSAKKNTHNVTTTDKRVRGTYNERTQETNPAKFIVMNGEPTKFTRPAYYAFAYGFGPDRELQFKA